MKQREKMKAYMYIYVFFICVMLLALCSFIKLVDFYVNDATVYNEWDMEISSKFEAEMTSSFYAKMQFVNFNGFMRNVLGQQEMNGVVKLNNGYLVKPQAYCTDEELQLCAEKLIGFDQYLKKKNIPMVYVQTPHNINKYDPQIPIGVEDFGNDNMDRLLYLLRQGNVDVLDMRELMYEDGIDQYSMMYKTDHHWTTEAGFYAYGKIEEYLQDALGCEVDERVSNIENYDVETYEKWHLGTSGQRTGIHFAGIDDFKLITPKFETKIQSGGAIGTLQELVINMEPLQNRNYESRYTYDFTLGKSQGDFKNLDCPNDVKLLIITDSMGNCVNPYFVLGFSEIVTRSNYAVSAVTKELIESYQPDAVVLLYYPGQIGKKAFSFQGFEE